MLTQHIALVPEAGGVDPAELARVSAALQKQMIRDLFPLWGIAATVSAFPQLEDVPVGFWPVVLTACELGHAGGVHIDRSGQPYAQVRLSPHWSLAASRACLEMLVNPFEHRSVTATSLRSDQGAVEFFVEVCAPCEDARNAYAIDDVLVSDFCTPAFFGDKTSEAPRYSFAGAVRAPMQPLPGGHMTWYDPVSGSYWLRNHWRDNPVDTQLGAIDRKTASVREIVNACTSLRAATERRLPAWWQGRGEQAARASQLQAQRLRALLGNRLDQDLDAARFVMRLEPETEAALEPHSVVLPPPPRVMPSARAQGHDEAEFEIMADVAIEEDTEVTNQYSLIELHEDAAPSDTPSSVPPPLPAPRVRESGRVPSRAPSRAPSPSIGGSTAPALRGGASSASIAPVTLASVGDRDESERRSKLPLIAGLAAAALIALVWGQRSHRVSHAQAAAPKHAAAAPAAVKAAAPPPVVTPPVPPPAAAVAPPAQPSAPPALAAPPVHAPSERAQTPPPAPKRRAATAHAASAVVLPVPPPPAPVGTTASASASIEDLIQTRK